MDMFMEHLYVSIGINRNKSGSLYIYIYIYIYLEVLTVPYGYIYIYIYLYMYGIRTSHRSVPWLSVGEDGRSRDADPEIATYKTRGVRCGLRCGLRCQLPSGKLT